MNEIFEGYTYHLLDLVLSAILSGVLTALLIPALKKRQFGQFIREEGPEAHLAKQGTPTMGGLAIFATMIIGSVYRGEFSLQIGIMLVVTFLFGLIGFLDDFMKFAKKQNLGMRAWQKLVLQIAFGVAVGLYMLRFSGHGSSVWIPFYGEFLDIGGFYVPFVAFIMVAMANAVNLTDGLDGLSSGVTSLVCICFGFVGLEFGHESGATFAFVVAGACIGFLFHNKYPAKIFMGDTGSMALGGAVAVIAIMMKAELLLPIAGFIYVMEALSVIIQVGSYKIRKKRVFRMAPIHHHFEEGGMKEYNVVFMFWGITAVLCVIAYISTL
ncbi:MAG: phospho-N-acetylmuramoyl-pentapeptide-transferase [Clostridiales bacterium]|nr:phospho-N-acetylmuramoyl-pentapeptide-transferase [Clostridiales bacterium]MDY4060384.1 phospho-N-acetylmuramoyl-pentapeptide-transferase [Anaerovoracaceae bacterium]